MTFRLSSASIFLAVWSIVGFPTLAILTNSFGLASTSFSISLRSITALFALLILASIARRKEICAYLFLIFWAVYFGRLLTVTIFETETLSEPVTKYWIWGVGVCFLPAYAAFKYNNQKNLDRIFVYLIVISLLSSGLALANGSTAMISSVGTIYDSGRLRFTSLNPISLGHLGVTSMLLGIWLFLSSRPFFARRWIATAAIFFGTSSATLANSKGPLVALFLCIAMLVLAGARRRKPLTFGVVLVIGLGYIGFNHSEVLFSSEGVLGRFSTALEDGDSSTRGRWIAYQGAFVQFMESPLFGDAIEEKTFQQYPHNVVLEAFMATGVVGGIPFLLLISWTASRAWLDLRSGSGNAWVGLLAVQYVVAGLFSGSLYLNGSMWVLIAMTSSNVLLRNSRANNQLVISRFNTSLPS